MGSTFVIAAAGVCTHRRRGSEVEFESVVEKIFEIFCAENLETNSFLRQVDRDLRPGHRLPRNVDRSCASGTRAIAHLSRTSSRVARGLERIVEAVRRPWSHEGRDLGHTNHRKGHKRPQRRLAGQPLRTGKAAAT